MPSTICAIIPTFNRAAMLRECIESILAQSRPPDRLIVVNDGSTDDTQTVAQSYGDRITLLDKPNGGKSSAVNLALRQCKEDYVWICDDDDIGAPGALAHLAAGLDANPQAGFIFGTFETFYDEGGQRIHSPPAYWMRAGEPNIRLQFLEEMFTFQFAMLVRRELYEKAGLFREDLGRSEDYEMILRLTRHAKGVGIPQIIFFQRRHNGARESKLNSFDSENNVQKWCERDRDLFSWVKREFTLDEFTPTFALQWESFRAKRAALVERACVMAEHGLWSEAIADFREATSLSTTSASPEELRLAEAIIRKPLPWLAIATNPAHITGLRECYLQNAYGKAIIFAACRPLVWLARKKFVDGSTTDGLGLLRTMHGILGLRGMFERVLASLLQ